MQRLVRLLPPILIIAAAAITYMCSAHVVPNNGRRQNFSTKGEEIAAFAAGLSGEYSTQDRVGPKSFDCSGFVYYVTDHFQIGLPSGNAQMQLACGEPVDCNLLKTENDTGKLLPGDLIFFDYEPDGKANHVGIYIGGDQIRHCWNGGVSTALLTDNFYKNDDRPLYSVVCGVRRVVS